jgi:general stress protein 26
MFHSDIGSSIYSIEHILRTQYFLKQHNIKYFFTDYIDENIVLNFLKNHPEINYLYNLIDKEHYLPVSSEFDWVLKNTKFHHLWNDPNHKYWEHPKKEMHKEFVEQVIHPWLENKGYLSTQNSVQLP